MMDAATFRARADECERLAEMTGYENHRDLLLEIAAKWRALARDMETNDAARKSRTQPKRPRR